MIASMGVRRSKGMWVGLLLGLAAPAAAPAAAQHDVLVAYYSHSGHTRLLAEAIAAGCRGTPADAWHATTTVRVQPTNATSGADLLAADAVIIGSPVYFGSQASEFSAWVEQTWLPYWQNSSLAGKKGAVFTTGGGLAQGLEHVLAELIRRLVHFKMDVVYPDQTFGAGYHSYGAIAVTGTPPWNATAGVDPVMSRARKFTKIMTTRTR